MPGIKPVIQCPPLESNAESRTETGASEQAARGVANNGPKLSNPLGQVRLHQGPDAAPDLSSNNALVLERGKAGHEQATKILRVFHTD